MENTRVESKSKTLTMSEKAKHLKAMRDKDRQMVKGVFKFYECPGALLEFVFKKYKEDPVEKFALQDGLVYTIPLGVAKHLNSNTAYPVHAHSTDDNGRPRTTIGTKVNRTGFQNLDFMDEKDLTPATHIVTVQSL